MALTMPAAGPESTGCETVTWLQPYPDALLDDLPDTGTRPGRRVEQHEAVSLAFITALQLLSPRARAVLILRTSWASAPVMQPTRFTPPRRRSR